MNPAGNQHEDTAKDLSISDRMAFLYKILDDNQATIRFIDTKAALAVAVLSAMIGKIASEAEYLLHDPSVGLWQQIVLCMFGVAALVSVVLLVRIIFPTSNPAANCNLESGAAGPPFLLSALSPKSLKRLVSNNPGSSKLMQSQAEYVRQIADAQPEDLIRSVSAEVLKVSYIRQIKTNRFGALTLAVAVAAIAFVLLIASRPPADAPVRVRVEGPVTLQSPAAQPSQTAQPQQSQIATPITQPAPQPSPSKGRAPKRPPRKAERKGAAVP
jgi:hypothetical protein